MHDLSPDEWPADRRVPAIVGYPADQFVALMGAYKDKHRDNQVMQTIVGRLTQEELHALATHYESLKPSQ